MTPKLQPDGQAADGHRPSPDAMVGDAGLLPPCPPLNLVSDTLDAWWWEGQPAPSWKLKFAPHPGPCQVDVQNPAPWLNLTLDTEAGRLILSVDTDTLSTGRFETSVTLKSPLSEKTTTLDVVVRLFRSATDQARRKVLVVGLDGVRADAFLAADTPHMDFLSTHAVFSTEAHTQLTANTKSGPGWASIMTGVDADKHGVTSNDTEVLEAHNPAYPSFLERAHEQLGLRTVAAVHWVPVLLLTLDDALDEVALGHDESVTHQMRDFLTVDDYDVHFVHLDDPDAAGHSTGFSADNPLYLEAIESCDTFVGQLLEGILARPTVAEEDWLVVVTTDHGGSATSHGPMDADNQTIFLVVAGASVTPELRGSSATHMDVHPTVMAFLGLAPTEEWGLDGQVVGLEVQD